VENLLLRKLCLLLAALLLWPGAARAADEPVAVISLVWGVVTIKHANEDYKPARWLEPIYPGDFVKTTGPGSKLLITFFNDNHQEVMGNDIVAQATETTMSATEPPNAKIRKDKGRNPFGSGGVQSPFVYARKIFADDFKGSEEPGALDAEKNIYLKAHVNPAFPPGFYWLPQSGATSYQLQVLQPSGGQPVWSTTAKTNQYKMKELEADILSKGSNYVWQVQANGQPVTRPYAFMLLTLPLEKWYLQLNKAFAAKRAAGKLERSDYTDYLLVCAQLYRVDETLTLVQEMSNMDPQNPNLFRALARVYLAKNCPALAKQAYDTEIQLGGYDPLIK